MAEVIAALIQEAGPAPAALGSPTGMPHAPRGVGPVVVCAHVLPFDVAPGALPVDADVRGHPHIGLAAMSYVLDGQITHRDSLGNRHEVPAGGIGWTLAGRGAVHSERLERLRLLGGRYQMLQILIALPDGHEDDEPAFVAVGPDQIPTRVADGATIRSLAGEGTAISFPVHLVLQDVELEAGGRHTFPTARERAVYVLQGEIRIGDTRVGAQHTARLDGGDAACVADAPARVLVFGGDPVGPRYLWWNFIHSTLESIERARARWRSGQYALPPGDTESFTPAPPDGGRPLMRLNAATGAK